MKNRLEIPACFFVCLKLTKSDTTKIKSSKIKYAVLK